MEANICLFADRVYSNTRREQNPPTFIHTLPVLIPLFCRLLPCRLVVCQHHLYNSHWRIYCSYRVVVMCNNKGMCKRMVKMCVYNCLNGVVIVGHNSLLIWSGFFSIVIININQTTFSLPMVCRCFCSLPGWQKFHDTSTGLWKIEGILRRQMEGSRWIQC